MAIKGPAKQCGSSEAAMVWYQNPTTSAWSLGSIVRPGAEEGMVCVADIRNPEVTFEVKESEATFPHNPSHDEDHSNISEMDDLHEAPLIDLLKRRHATGDIYTYANFVLIAVNPHRTLEGLYDGPTGPQVLAKAHPPHLHVIAQRAYSELDKGASLEGAGGLEKKETYQNQAILISGESGAGKTQSSKQIIRYLASLSSEGAAASSSKGADSSGLAAIEHSLVACSPLLESLGNSTTRMNHNSSRFGRLTRILFTEESPSLIRGAKIESFLLEKTRVTARTPNERSFHVFFQLLTSAEHCAEYALSQDVQEHHYLNCGRAAVPTIDDAADFNEFLESMKQSFSAASQDAKVCLDLVAAILHLGNVGVDEENDEAVLLPGASLDLAIQLLKLPDASNVSKQVCCRSVVVNGQLFTTPLTELQAMANRDAVAKAVYGWLFDSVVDNINKTLASASALATRGEQQPSAATTSADATASSAGEKSIAILDIYGFEVMENNSLEQLLINLANENLQQIFNDRVLLSEQEMYSAAGVAVDLSGALLDDSETLRLLVSKSGVLRCLDDQNKSGIGTDRQFLASLERLHGSNRRYATPKSGKYRKEHFIVKHYAGDVMYDSVGCVEKNGDKLSAGCVQLLGGSGAAGGELGAHFSSAALLLGKGSEGEDTDKEKKGKGGKTISQVFLVQLEKLMNSLRAARAHYIRCIRPNTKASATEFNQGLVLKQLKYFGVMEVVRIRRAGFPERKALSDFVNAYEILFPKRIVPAANPPPSPSSMPATPSPRPPPPLPPPPKSGAAGARPPPPPAPKGRGSLPAAAAPLPAKTTTTTTTTTEPPPRDAQEGLLRGQCRSLFLRAEELFPYAPSSLPSPTSSAPLAAVATQQAQFGNDGCVWMKDGFLKWMDSAVAAHLSNFATKIQSLGLAHNCKRRFQRAKASALKLSSYARTRSAVRKLTTARAAATRLASLARRRQAASLVARKRANRSGDAATKVAARWRQFLAARALRWQRQGAVVLQASVRRRAAVLVVARKRVAAQQRNAATVIEAGVRRKQAVKLVKRKREALEARLKKDAEAKAAAEEAEKVRVAKEEKHRAEVERGAAVEIQCMFRFLLAMMACERRGEEREARLSNIGALKVQALWGGFKLRRWFGFVSKLRHKWRRLLGSDELVVLSTPCLWNRGGLLGSVKRVQLLVTSHRRILLVDESEHGGNVETLKSLTWNASVAIELPTGSHALSGKKFTIVHDKKKVNLTALIGTAARMKFVNRTLVALDDAKSNGSPVADVWIRITNFNVSNGLENFPVEMQGLLKKHRVKKPTVVKLGAVGKGGAAAEDGDDSDEEGVGRASVAGGSKGGPTGSSKSQTRYFVLQGGLLRYFGASSAEPKGVLDLTVAANMMGGDDGFNPMSRLSTVGGSSSSKAKEVKVAASADGLGFTLSLPNGTELDAAALPEHGEQDREDWVHSLEAVCETMKVKSGALGQDKGTRESVAFASMSADESVVVEDHKRRLLRRTKFLF